MNTPANDTRDLVGQILFSMNEDTFVKVKAVADKPDPIIEVGRLMTVIDLKNGEEVCAHFVEDIGEEFWPLEPDYPQEKIEAYLEAARVRDEVDAIMLEVTQEVLSYVPERG